MPLSRYIVEYFRDTDKEPADKEIQLRIGLKDITSPVLSALCIVIILNCFNKIKVSLLVHL